MGVLLTPVIVMMRLLGDWIAPYQIGSLLAGTS
jgi:hypothetical protein